MAMKQKGTDGGMEAKALRMSVRPATKSDMEEAGMEEYGGPMDLDEQLRKVMKLSGEAKNQAIEAMVSVLCALKDEGSEE